VTEKQPRAWALACPQCGGGLRVASTAMLDCPSCASPLAVLVPGSWAREVILPRIEAAEAVRRARSALAHPQTAPRYLAEGHWEEPRLVFVALYEVERTLADRRGRRTEVREIAPAVRMAELPADQLHLASLAGRERAGYDPVSLQRRGAVIEPALAVDEALPAPGTTRVLEEQVRVVYAPIWVLECRLGRNVYPATLDATTGRLLAGRAPARRTARLGQALATLYALAFLLACLPIVLPWYLALIRHVGEAAVIGLFAVGGLGAMLSAAWDRIRFRYEVVGQGEGARLRPINRPEATLLELIARAEQRGRRG